jgi:hypothetical protein
MRLKTLLWRRQQRGPGMMGIDVPYAIKIVSPAEIESLVHDAMRAGFSGTGRPSWLARHREEIRRAWAHAMFFESSPSPSWRCMFTLEMSGRTFVNMPIDVHPRRFTELQDADRAQERRLLRQFLESIPILDVEGDDQSTDGTATQG